jgi:transposase
VPREVRDEVCRYAARRRREGAAWAVIARETGLDARKLQRWRSRARSAAPVPVLRPVEVVSKPDVVPDVSPPLALVAPSGLRIEGLRRPALPPARVIGLSRRVRVFAYTRPVDMRKQYDGLYALVVSELNADPLSGDLFLFTNRRRTRAKVLLWDGTGLCIYQKRIERGRFASLWRGDEEETVEMTLSELALFLEGSTLAGALRLSPSPTSPQVLTSFLHETQRC